MFGGFSASKLKPQLKMGMSRIQIASNKKAALLKQHMREVAVMLSEDPPKEEKAKIKAEALIRDDNLIEAYEILQLECELLHERMKLIEFSKDCPADLVPVVSTIMWASHRVDVPELSLIRKQFRAKYGKKFEDAAMNNVGGVLNERVVTKLSVDPPAAYLVQTYLERICDQFHVEWTPKIKLSARQMIEPTAAPIGYSVPVAQGTGLGPAIEATTGVPDADEEISYMKQNGGIPPPVVTATVGGGGAGGFGAGGVIPPMAPGAGGGVGPPPVVSATPYVPPNHNNNRNNNNNNGGGGGGDFEEVDIFVPPGAPSAPPGDTSTVTMDHHITNNSNIGGGVGGGGAGRGGSSTNGDGNCFDGIPPAAPGAGTTGGGGDGAGGSSSASQSYADLAARFSKLKK